jgi:methyl-accepting chemotaxis protein
VDECSPLRRRIVADMDMLLKRLQQNNGATVTRRLAMAA